MKFLNLIELFVKRALICFALIVLAFSIVGSLLDVQLLGKGLGVNQLLGFFLFSVLLSLSFEISMIFRKNAVLRGAIRFVLSCASFIAVVFLGSSFSLYLSEKQNPAYSVIVITFFYVIIYVICSLAGFVYNTIKNKISNSNKEYENVYFNEN